jgi:hypothetical protein
MICPPTSLWGLAIKPGPNAAPEEIDAIRVPLNDGVIARIRFLRWNLADFESDVSAAKDPTAWFLTLVAEAQNGCVHLWQADSVFYTGGASVSAVDASDVKLQPSPNWHRRSDLSWPVTLDGPLAFSGQFQSLEHVGYVFGSIRTNTVAILLFVRGEQDVQDHYNEEEKRMR